MDIVLGVSTAPSMVRMVLVEGENADGATVEEDTFEVTAGDEAATSSAAEQVVSAIVGTRESAAEAGYQLSSIGVTWTDPSEAAGLRDALATRDVGSTMLVSPLLAAAALAQTVGAAMNYAYTALLFVEPESSTLALVDTADGSIVNLQRRLVHSADAVDELTAMVASLSSQETRADGAFIVGCGVDIVPIKSALESATTLPVNAPEEPDMALARGAALASANAPLFASGTAALAYARDPGTGEVNPYKLAPEYIDVVANADVGTGALAYSAVLEEEDERRPRRRRFALAGSAVAAIFVVGVVALLVSLAADVRPSVGQRPSPGGNVVIPTQQAPPPPPPAAASPPAAPAPPPAAPAPAPAASPPPPTQAAPAPAPQTIPAPVQPPPSAAPEAPVYRAPPRQAPTYVPPPVQQAPAYVPPPVEQAPAPPPVAPPPPPAAPPPPPAPQLPPMTMYLHLPFVTVPIPINPPPPPPGQ